MPIPPSLEAESTPPPRSGGRDAETRLGPSRALSPCSRPRRSSRENAAFVRKQRMTRGVSGPREHQPRVGNSDHTAAPSSQASHHLAVTSGQAGSARGAADPAASPTSSVPSGPRLSSEPGSLGHRLTSPTQSLTGQSSFPGKMAAAT